MSTNHFEAVPLKNLDEWEDDLLRRYPDPASIAAEKSTEAYRNYDTPERDTVKEFYRLNHTYQTYDFVQEKRADYLKFDKKEMPVWDAFSSPIMSRMMRRSSSVLCAPAAYCSN